jgi:cob(I)alamin adenosyltransferase
MPGAPPIAKDTALPEAFGAIDELSAVLGMVRAEPLSEDVERLLRQIQHDLSAILADIGARDPTADAARRIGLAQVRSLEEAINGYQETLQPLEGFILPGGVRPAATLHLARTVCRRAERRLVALLRADQPQISASLTAYLNRLGDLLFVLARTVNRQAGYREVSSRKEDA